ncbi:hypothetical protein MKY14_13815 [Paenibacillus sp. FSL R5-0887]|uniref:hypothetical protein n=1 Tax=unclassified Paenibacillus TaxID=185978 RepID=UPI0030F60294
MKKRKNISVNTTIIIVFLITTIIIPIIINRVLFLPYPTTANDLGNKDWLAFWGSFLGGSLGGVATLFAVYYTLKQNIEQNQNNLNIQYEKSRKDIIPYIDVRLFLDNSMGNPAYFMFKGLFEEEDKSKEGQGSEEKTVQFPSGYILFKNENITYSNKLDKKYKAILEQGGIEQRQEGNVISFYDSKIQMAGITLCNIGMSSAIDVTLELNSNSFSDYAIMPSFNLRVSELNVLRFVFDRDFPEGDHIFIIKINDLHGNRYVQTFKVKLKSEGNYLERVTPPKLISTDSIFDEQN